MLFIKISFKELFKLTTSTLIMEWSGSHSVNSSTKATSVSASLLAVLFALNIAKIKSKIYWLKVKIEAKNSCSLTSSQRSCNLHLTVQNGDINGTYINSSEQTDLFILQKDTENSIIKVRTFSCHRQKDIYMHMLLHLN